MKYNGKTIFLDRDGVINVKAPEGEYIRSWQEFKFLPGVIEAMSKLKQSGYRLILITNQRGIARKLMTEDDLKTIHNNMQSELSKYNACFDAIYYCPHDKNECNCRKPDIGMFLKALMEFPDIDFDTSYMIGDSITDMLAGKTIGCKNIFINNKDLMMGKDINPYGNSLSLKECVFKYFI